MNSIFISSSSKYQSVYSGNGPLSFGCFDALKRYFFAKISSSLIWIFSFSSCSTSIVLTIPFWVSNIFDTQKGIVRTIEVEQLENEKIQINDDEILAKKYLFNASKHPKDKGPFPEYTLWYFEDELMKMEFKNPNDKKNIIKIVRNDWGN